jgi:hypothetical protein
MAAETVDFRVHVGLLSVTPAAICPQETRTNGVKESLSWQPCAPICPGDWMDLTAQEAALFRQCVHAGRYRCPHCQDEHAAAILRFPRRKQTSIRGLPIYQVLQELPGKGPGKGFALFHDFGDQVRLRHHPCPALPLPGRAVAMRWDTDVAVYRFDEATQVWRLNLCERLNPYNLVGADNYAIVL